MEEKPTLTQFAMRNETEIDKVVKSSVLIPPAARTVLKEQAAIIRMMAAAIDSLKLGKQAG